MSQSSCVNIITRVFCHSPENTSNYPNSTGDPCDLPVQDLCWRCALSLLHSAKQLHRDAPVRVHLFSNLPPPKEIDYLDIGRLINEANIEWHQLKTKTTIPSDYFHSVTSQFLLVDLLEQLNELMTNGVFTKSDLFVILDCDCIFQRPLSQEFVDDVERDGCINYAIFYANDIEEKGGEFYGLTMYELLDIAREYQEGEKLEEYYAMQGEMICVSASHLEPLARESRRALSMSLNRHKNKERKFHTEEQMFGYVMSRLGYPRNVAEDKKYITRVWTHPQFTTYEPELHSQFTILHMPSEKDLFFVNYFRQLRAFFQLNLSV